MIPALATLLVLVPAAAPTARGGKAPVPVVREEAPGPEKQPVWLATRDDIARLCGALVPPERLRPEGDAVDRGEAEERHDRARAAALKERYEAMVPAGKLAFAPYDGPERLLALREPVVLPLPSGIALWPTEARGLAVEVEAGVARRVLEAQRRGALSLGLVFDLPEDAICGTGSRGKTFTLAVEPVAWRWLDGEAVLAHGGAAAERPLVSAAQGARPNVDVGEPIAGPAEVKQVVLARARELEACYADALRRDPRLDGVLVADFGGARAAISADSVGDAGLAACVQKVIGPLAPARGGKAAVPIRFELAPPAGPAKAE